MHGDDGADDYEGVMRDGALERQLMSIENTASI